jgi:deoxyribodipyrimidine photolyase
MKIAAKNIAHYSKTRDDLYKPTSQLSAYIKFGCISIREVHKLFKSQAAQIFDVHIPNQRNQQPFL